MKSPVLLTLLIIISLQSQAMEKKFSVTAVNKRSYTRQNTPIDQVLFTAWNNNQKVGELTYSRTYGGDRKSDQYTINDITVIETNVETTFVIKKKLINALLTYLSSIDVRRVDFYAYDSVDEYLLLGAKIAGGRTQVKNNNASMYFDVPQKQKKPSTPKGSRLERALPNYKVYVDNESVSSSSNSSEYESAASSPESSLSDSEPYISESESYSKQALQSCPSQSSFVTARNSNGNSESTQYLELDEPSDADDFETASQQSDTSSGRTRAMTIYQDIPKQ